MISPILSTTAYGTCQFCGQLHPRTKCPLIKAISYDQFGQVTRIEFFELQLPKFKVPADLNHKICECESCRAARDV